MGVVIRGLHDAAAAAGLDSLRRAIDIGGLDANHDLPGHGMVGRSRQRQCDRARVEGREVRTLANEMFSNSVIEDVVAISVDGAPVDLAVVA